MNSDSRFFLTRLCATRTRSPLYSLFWPRARLGGHTRRAAIIISPYEYTRAHTLVYFFCACLRSPPRSKLQAHLTYSWERAAPRSAVRTDRPGAVCGPAHRCDECRSAVVTAALLPLRLFPLTPALQTAGSLHPQLGTCGAALSGAHTPPWHCVRPCTHV